MANLNEQSSDEFPAVPGTLLWHEGRGAWSVRWSLRA